MPRTKRKDKSRAVLRTGESQRADGTYQFRWTDSNHKRFCVYAKTLDELRYKEEQIKKDKSDGIKTEARYTTVNEVYELWKELKRGLKNNTFENYKYMFLPAAMWSAAQLLPSRPSQTARRRQSTSIIILAPSPASPWAKRSSCPSWRLARPACSAPQR